MAEVKYETWKYKTENASSCPFCGSNSVSVLHKQKRFIGYNGIGFKKIAMQVYCICNRCHSKGKPISYIGYEANHGFYDEEHLPIYSCGDKAIEAWNTRKSMEAVVAALEKQVEQYDRRAEEHKDYEDYHSRYYSKARSYEHACVIVRNGGKE